MRTVLHLMLFLVVCVSACQDAQYSDDYRVIRSPQNEEYVVVQDDDGESFLMNYLLWQSLMNSGGRDRVIHHYHESPSSYRRYTDYGYNDWKSVRTVPYSTYGNRANAYRSSENATQDKPVFKTTTVNKPPAYIERPKFKTTTVPKSTYEPSRSRPTFKTTTATGPSSSYKSSSTYKSSSSGSSPSSSSSRPTFKTTTVTRSK